MVRVRISLTTHLLLYWGKYMHVGLTVNYSTARLSLLIIKLIWDENVIFYSAFCRNLRLRKKSVLELMTPWTVR